jgi:citrate lyase subunit beta/citryl-CoA lyase
MQAAAQTRRTSELRLHTHVEHPPGADPAHREALSPRQDVREINRPPASLLPLPPSHADWAPVSTEGVLHDRASYRYYWQFLERAHATGRTLPPEVQTWFVSSR